MSTLSLKLGEKTFEISQLTIEQLMQLRVGDATAPKPQEDGAGGWRSLYELCVRTIAVGLREAHPEIKETDVWKMKLTEQELSEARRDILLHAGLRSPERTIAELRADVATKKLELELLQKTLSEREAKAKITGEE